MPKTPSTYDRIYAMVRSIPRGKVSTYGQIAKWARASGPRQVGYALHAIPDGLSIPWHRVINAKGELSLPSGSDAHEVQRTLLEAEGIRFDEQARVDLKTFQWVKKR